MWHIEVTIYESVSIRTMPRKWLYLSRLYGKHIHVYLCCTRVGGKAVFSFLWSPTNFSCSFSSVNSIIVHSHRTTWFKQWSVRNAHTHTIYRACVSHKLVAFCLVHSLAASISLCPVFDILRYRLGCCLRTYLCTWLREKWHDIEWNMSNQW